MGKVDAIADKCQRLLSAQGRLSTAIPGFVARQPQTDLAVAIAKAISQKSILVAEAGTGTGKTFAYLLPGLLSAKKMLISTATKTLQDQLFNKDLPLLAKALGLSLQVQNLKGRANYICRHRVALNAEEGQFQTPQCVHEILHIREKLPQLRLGEKSELPEISEDSAVWPYVTSTTDNCLGSECPEHQSCFLMKARKRALEANVVVINHHLFFADSRLKEGGFGELLPGVDVVIFDEAHQLTEIAANFYGERFGSRQLRDVLDDMLHEWPVLDLANQPLKALSLKLDAIIDKLLFAFPEREERLAWQELRNHSAFMAAWQDFVAIKGEIEGCLGAEKVAETPGLKTCKSRLEEMDTALQLFLAPTANKIRWVERFKQSLAFHATPFEIAEVFSALLQAQPCAYVFTSATLTMANSFDCFTKPLGLTEIDTLLLPSPFNYQEQALLYLPRSLPDPKHADYYPQLLKRVIPLVEAFGGGCFFLFTSHKALKQVAQLLGNTLKYPLLIQGEESKPILLDRFRQLGNAVLLGTATFWEGVDVKGDALSCVIIDKLPFASPADPVVNGKMAYLKAQGLSPFDEFSLPDAVLALKQGVGRLIRDISDKGLLVIADPRVTARDYGKVILSSLPDLPKTRDEQRVLHFIKGLYNPEELTVKDEIASD